MTKLETNYPLDSCRDCLHTDVCKLKEGLNEFLSKNDYLDISNGFCDHYVEDEVSPSEDWKKYVSSLVEEAKASHNEDNTLNVDMEFMSVEETLNEVIGDILTKGYNPDKLHVSSETLEMFLFYVEIDGVFYIKTSHGNIEIDVDDSIETGYFLVTFIRDTKQ